MKRAANLSYNLPKNIRQTKKNMFGKIAKI
jgi:hypothetical protein